MDRWKYFAITHRDHVICNPFSEAKIDELIGLLDLRKGARVLDIGCGKAEMLLRMAERCHVMGVGVDPSPQFAADARAGAAARGLGNRVEIVEVGGADYGGAPESFDASLCLGASWAFGGYRGTLNALRGFTRPEGVVVVGEPYWKRTPPPDYVAAADFDPGLFDTHMGNVASGVDEGLAPLYTLVSSDDDWDRYQGLQWRAAERYAREHPDDPDVPELLRQQRKSRDDYLRWERDILGWAVYVFLK